MRRARVLLPSFLAVGPPRTGTTWLDKVLRGRVGLPEGIKETRFFDLNYDRGIGWYSEFFRGCDASLPAGEICPTYFEHADARVRIAHHLPTCRIIVTLRDPAERAYSQFKLLRKFGYAGSSFEEALRKEPLRDCGRYAFHLQQWQKLLGKPNVLAVCYDRLQADPQAYVDRICDLVGISRFALADSKAATRKSIRNVIKEAPRHPAIALLAWRLTSSLESRRMYRASKILGRLGFWRIAFKGGEEFAPLSREVAARTREFFKPEVEAVERLIGIDLSSWKEGAKETAIDRTYRDGAHPLRQ